MEAIDIYLRIMEENNACYYDLLVSMYKSVLCAGCFHFAYELIAVSEIMIKVNKGIRPKPHPLFPFLQPEMWRQTELRRELEDLLVRNEYYLNLTNASDEEYKKAGEKVLADFEETIRPYSGDPDYRFPCTLGHSLVERIALGLRAKSEWHTFHGQYLD